MTGVQLLKDQLAKTQLQPKRDAFLQKVEENKMGTLKGFVLKCLVELIYSFLALASWTLL